MLCIQFSSVAQSCPTLCDPMIAACQASQSITNSRSSLRLTSIESVMSSSHLILYRPLLLLPPIPPRIRVFSNESTLRMRWAKYWSLSFSISPSNEHPGLLSFNPEAYTKAIEYRYYLYFLIWTLTRIFKTNFVSMFNSSSICQWKDLLVENKECLLFLLSPGKIIFQKYSTWRNLCLWVAPTYRNS